MRQQVKYYNNFIHWFFNDKYHRDVNLPAVYYFTDKKLDFVEYCQHNKHHRTTGPAYINYQDKIKEYWYHGMRYASLEKMLMAEACR